MSKSVKIITKFCEENNCTLEGLIQRNSNENLKRILVRRLVKKAKLSFSKIAEILRTSDKIAKFYYYSPLKDNRGSQMQLLRHKLDEYQNKVNERMDWINNHPSNHPEFDTMISDRNHFLNEVADTRTKIQFLESGQSANGLPDGPEGLKLTQAINFI